MQLQIRYLVVWKSDSFGLSSILKGVVVTAARESDPTESLDHLIEFRGLIATLLKVPGEILKMEKTIGMGYRHGKNFKSGIYSFPLYHREGN